MKSSPAIALSGATIALLMQQGCMVMAPSPAVEAMNMVSVAALYAASTARDNASNQYVHPHARLRHICIEHNRSVQVDDFLPALQNELRSGGVDSRVYEKGMQPSDCEAVLDYNAYLAWDRPLLGKTYTSYMTFAALTLRVNGRVLASANYEEGRLQTDKWASTGAKISPVVKALLADN